MLNEHYQQKPEFYIVLSVNTRKKHAGSKSEIDSKTGVLKKIIHTFLFLAHFDYTRSDVDDRRS